MYSKTYELKRWAKHIIWKPVLLRYIIYIWYLKRIRSMCVEQVKNMSVLRYFVLTVARHWTGCHAISKQEVSAPISCWVTFDPTVSPPPLSRKCCVLALVNMIPKFPTKKLQISLRFIIVIQQILCDTRFSLKTLFIKKTGVCEDLPPNLLTVAEIFCLENGCHAYIV